LINAKVLYALSKNKRNGPHGGKEGKVKSYMHTCAVLPTRHAPN